MNIINALFTTASLLFYSLPAAYADDDADTEKYILACADGMTCDAGKDADLAYGADTNFKYRKICGRFMCAAELFGWTADPAGNAAPACYKKLKPGKKPSATDTVIELPGQTTSALNIKPALSPSQKTTGLDSNLSVSPDKMPGAGATGDASECVEGAVIKDKVVDCEGKSLGTTCNGHDEFQKPILTLENATVKNVVIKKGGAADGIHCTRGDCMLINPVWEDICEDAATNVSEGGTFTISGGSAYNDNKGEGKPDKIFQHNSKNSTFVITGGFTAKGINGILWASCGNCKDNSGPRHAIIDNVILDSEITEAVAVYNKNFNDDVQIKNLKIKNYVPGKPSVCYAIIGEQPGTTKFKTLGESWDTEQCKVTKSDVTPN